MLTDARLALLAGCLATVSLLALTERFAALPGALIAFVAAHVVTGRAHAEARRPAVHDDCT